MALRIRCPQCRTVQRVPSGVRPVCPQCGFSGTTAANAEAPAAEAATWGQPDAQNVSWEATPALGASGAAGAAAPSATWTEPTWAEADPPADAQKKKGWFGRSK